MDWETLRSGCLACTRCELCKTRTNVVFGQGVENAKVLFVGEGPGQSEEDRKSTRLNSSHDRQSRMPSSA